MKFELTPEEMLQVHEFYQKNKIGREGTIGGGITYEFTPTSLGVVTKVTLYKGMPQEVSLDLTDYESW